MLNYKRTKYTCYFTYVAMSSVFSLPPMLFITFHEMYGISYTLLGSLLLVNFCSQLVIDLLFTFFSKHFNIKTTIRIMPLITTTGLAVYALVPHFFPSKAAIGLFGGTVIFSIAAGLCEVLLSPVVSSLPSDHKEKDLSILHSLYGWGVVSVVIVSSMYFFIFGTEKWVYLTIFWALLPIVSAILFSVSPIPEIKLDAPETKKEKTDRNKGIFLCAVCIFLGSGAENTMTGWISGFMEKSLLVPKALGDVLGMALFAALLGATRSIYAKFGKNIRKMLTVSMAGAIVCYLAAGLSVNVYVGFAACVLTGIFTSMLWPGTLIMMEEKVPSPGVAAYALMAACGDFGASFAPQLMGVIVDKASVNEKIQTFGAKFSLLPEQTGLKIGMLCATVIPVLGLVWMLFIKKSLYSAKSKE